MNPFEMVVLIVAIVSITSIVRSRYRAERVKHADTAAFASDPDADRLRDEVRVLKERVAVLERIATDNSDALGREIDALRSRD